MIIIRENNHRDARSKSAGFDRLDEKLTGFTRAIKDNAHKSAVSSLGDIVNRNKNMQTFLDAGEEPAVILAYLLGTLEGVLDYTSFLPSDKQLKIRKIIAWTTSVESSLKTELTKIQ